MTHRPPVGGGGAGPACTSNPRAPRRRRPRRNDVTGQARQRRAGSQRGRNTSRPSYTPSDRYAWKVVGHNGGEGRSLAPAMPYPTSGSSGPGMNRTCKVPEYTCTSNTHEFCPTAKSQASVKKLIGSHARDASPTTNSSRRISVATRRSMAGSVTYRPGWWAGAGALAPPPRRPEGGRFSPPPGGSIARAGRPWRPRAGWAEAGAGGGAGRRKSRPGGRHAILRPQSPAPARGPLPSRQGGFGVGAGARALAALAGRPEGTARNVGARVAERLKGLRVYGSLEETCFL